MRQRQPAPPGAAAASVPAPVLELGLPLRRLRQRGARIRFVLRVRSRTVLPIAAVGFAWTAIAACVATLLYLDHRLSEIGRSDLADAGSSGLFFLVPIVSSA